MQEQEFNAIFGEVPQTSKPKQAAELLTDSDQFVYKLTTPTNASDSLCRQLERDQQLETILGSRDSIVEQNGELITKKAKPIRVSSAPRLAGNMTREEGLDFMSKCFGLTLERLQELHKAKAKKETQELEKCDCPCAECIQGHCEACLADEKCAMSATPHSKKIQEILLTFRSRLAENLTFQKALNTTNEARMQKISGAFRRLTRSVNEYVQDAVRRPSL